MEGMDEGVELEETDEGSVLENVAKTFFPVMIYLWFLFFFFSKDMGIEETRMGVVHVAFVLTEFFLAIAFLFFLFFYYKIVIVEIDPCPFELFYADGKDCDSPDIDSACRICLTCAPRSDLIPWACKHAILCSGCTEDYLNTGKRSCPLCYCPMFDKFRTSGNYVRRTGLAFKRLTQWLTGRTTRPPSARELFCTAWMISLLTAYGIFLYWTTKSRLMAYFLLGAEST